MLATACTINMQNPSSSGTTGQSGTGKATGSGDSNNPQPGDFADSANGACGAFALAEDSSVFHMVAERSYTWEPGTTLNVVFMDGREENMRAVAETATEWTKYANIDFAFFGPDDDVPRGPQLRISFQRPGYWSLIGSQAAYRDESIPTMNMHFSLFSEGRREIQRVVLHEFGHALGLWHEHQNPKAQFTWNKDVIYEYYRRTHGWDQDTVDSNIFERLDRSRVTASEFDANSIMLYSFPRAFTVEGVRMPDNYQLSATDKREIAALYPGRRPDGDRPPEPDRNELAELQSKVRFLYALESSAESQHVKNYAIIVDAPDQVLDRIDHVLYQRQHRSFQEFGNGSYHRSASRRYAFGFGWQGWGWVPVKAHVVWDNGKVTEHFHRSAPVPVDGGGPDWEELKEEVGFSYTASASEDGWRVYRIALDDPEVAAHVHWIEYQRQHETFVEFARRHYIRRDGQGNNFAFQWRGYGWVKVEIKVHFKDGTTAEYTMDEPPTRE